ncbi:MAG: hypothetical protein A2729_01140 [Candidatus Buchananbacteria bacterium RIFCSPHIGHO2_01_FULL_39_14]|uniref:Uncharacterized protein n=2 Tax=Candidatus Buchananiibacteriota TaxID=1817903 RepID=A0A1G1YVW5_9BACT|nr:MAG: hypothetical protein A2729_01140 [Candidatus Buchananbacteria bacterium RIFCSPHIGHO2_01_FULL_39_14]OGY49173.1 MAG: hypothetical protein A3D39_05700 [Candidatus Buchananbacteria bacterium RIFCSPHIGHO2_02_FULL_39_17]OGY55906.1 MAG: hypothetical protein A2912_02880 [Candidatus Buchananbacteria bacterium RIFCSPLOWO2_01_FULL_40_23b]
MSDEPSEHRLDFLVQNEGIAKGWKVILTNQCLQYHINKYGKNRPELLNNNFIDKDIQEAIENPDYVYPSIKKVFGRIKKRKTIVFYKEKVNRTFILNGKEMKYFVKIVIRRKRGKILDIVTALITPNINEGKLCQPLTKI